MIPANAAPIKEWWFSIDWNNPVHVESQTLNSNMFQPLGLNISWDADTWLVNVYLLLFVIRFGRVDVQPD